MNEAPQLITIKEAAAMLGVTPLTLRNWDKSGKLKALRHPMNNYRVYRRHEVQAIVSGMDTVSIPARNKSRKTPRKLEVRHITE